MAGWAWTAARIVRAAVAAGICVPWFGGAGLNYQTNGLERELAKLRALVGGGDEVEITDEQKHAEAVQQLSAAVDAKRSDDALLGAAWATAAANGDPFGKLSRYETAALNRLRHLIVIYDELKTRCTKGQRASSAGCP